MQCDDGERQSVGGARHPFRHSVDVDAEFDDESGRARRGQSLQVRHARRVVRERPAGGEDEFATLEEVRQIG